MSKCLKAVDDVMGKALLDYQGGMLKGELIVHTTVAEDEPYDVAVFFRNYDEMPLLEQKALELASGSILDVGAGTGIHSLALEKMGKKCKAIDISELSVEIMKEEGVESFSCEDFYELKNQKYDTLLLLMNGIGIVETMDGFQRFFNHCETILKIGGQILLDSSDIIYLFEEEDGSYLVQLNEKYYGEVEFQVEYNGAKGIPFPWLFIDFDNLQHQAEKYGFQAELIQNGEHFDYLARITLKTIS
ncbi:MAG: methyltransferase domain-containing protein [Bacteroidales bacterium]|nr:methyltransferase domain-containing protein [Bacteroidales bacterium]